MTMFVTTFEKHRAMKEVNVRSIVQMVTPEEARTLRDTAHFSRQRNISRANVSRLDTEMKAGRFIPGTQVYIGVLPDSRQLILNGNHTLEAVYESGKPQILTMTYMDIKDEDEAGRLYAVFDIHKTRTWMDSLRGMGKDKMVKEPNKVASAVGVIMNGFEQGGFRINNSRPDRGDKMDAYEEAADMFFTLLQGAPKINSKLVKRAGVMAVALETLRYQPSSAVEFWTGVVQGVGLDHGSPELALMRWLQNNPAAGTKSRREVVNSTALAWNAFFDGRSIEFCRPNALKNFVLRGTPHARGLVGNKTTA